MGLKLREVEDCLEISSERRASFQVSVWVYPIQFKLWNVLRSLEGCVAFSHYFHALFASDLHAISEILLTPSPNSRYIPMLVTHPIVSAIHQSPKPGNGLILRVVRLCSARTLYETSNGMMSAWKLCREVCHQLFATCIILAKARRWPGCYNTDIRMMQDWTCRS